MDLAVKKGLIDMNHTQLNIKQQCTLLGLNRSSYYASPTAITAIEQKILNRMDEIFTEHPYYGNRRMVQVLRAEGIMIGRKKVRRYYQILGIEAIYPNNSLRVFV